MLTSFDLSHRLVDDPSPIEEAELMDGDPIEDSFVAETGETFTLMKGASEKERDLVVSSLGYSYSVKRVNKKSVLWRCTSRQKTKNCSATVSQKGNTWTSNGQAHLHAAVPNKLMKTAIYSETRSRAREDVMVAAMEVVDDIVLEAGPNVVEMPKRALLKRMANRNRARFGTGTAS